MYLHGSVHGKSRLKRINRNTLTIQDVELPMEGSVTSGGFIYSLYYRGGDKLYFQEESWTRAATLYSYDPSNQVIEEVGFDPNSEFDSPDYLTTTVVEVKSHDGTMVPLTILHHKETELDGNNPTIIMAYGVYGISMTPYFDNRLLPWLKRGGIYAVAHIRGGGEKGDAWHNDGKLKNKHNSWKDYIACAEYLVDQNYTSSQKLSAWSGSAGCIPVGKAVTLRPELFKTAVLLVGTLNPLRFEFSSNKSNTTEFGSQADAQQFADLLEQDPYMNIKEEEQYPAFLLTAGVNDPRVDIWQISKMAARLQSANTEQIVLFKVNENAGHFSGENGLEEFADIFSFLFDQMNEETTAMME